MSPSNPAQPPDADDSKPSGKRRMPVLRKVLLSVLAVLLALVAVLGWVIMQPIWTHNRPSQEKVDPGRLKAHVSVLSETYHPRSWQDGANLKKSADYIREQFSQAGGVLGNQIYSVGRLEFENVILLFPGEDETRVIVGAHYDAVEGTPGADDNASGVAGLIELARLLSPLRLQHTVELVAYCTEEPPFFGTDDMGSARHAAWLRTQGVNVRAMIALEMIGYFTDKRGSQSYPVPFLRLFYPSRGNFIAVVGNTGQRGLLRDVKRAMGGSTDLPVRSASIPGFVPGIDFSDHRNYWKHGYPAVMVTDTAFFRNRTYHQPSDTGEQLDYERMSKVVIGVCEAVKALAIQKSVEQPDRTRPR